MITEALYVTITDTAQMYINRIYKGSVMYLNKYYAALRMNKR